ncbi:MAG: hypothetical protein JNK51_07100 [Blastocatellia bacterium]|nr:hypothetical protein [Blastocatellia bacterium]
MRTAIGIEEIDEIVRKFETCTIERSNWHHREHLLVALYYVERVGAEHAIEKMREGIFRLLTEAFNVDLTAEMPYHETLTVFWVRAVDAFRSAHPNSSLNELADEMTQHFDKELPLRFYSRELLFSDRARETFIEPDVRAFEPSALLAVGESVNSH